MNVARLGWQLLDERSALLRVGPLIWYREAFEIWRALGYHHTLGHHPNATVRLALGVARESPEGEPYPSWTNADWLPVCGGMR